MFSVSRSAADFSGLGGIWDGPSHSGKRVLWSDKSVFQVFFGRNGHCVLRPKKKRTIQTVTSNKTKSQGQSCYGVVSVPLAKVTYTSVMAPFMPKSKIAR